MTSGGLFSFLLALGCLAVVPLVRGDDGDCSLQYSCSSCTGQTGCGWCDNRCVNGSLTAPTDNTITCNCYHGNSSSCVACAATTDCATCVSSPGCSFLQYGAQCVEHYAYQTPANLTKFAACAYPGQTTGSGDTHPDCSTFTDCGSCSAQRDCGWCADGAGACIEATIDTAASCGAACSSFHYDSCPDPCLAHKSCSECKASAGCGWCGDVCLNGTAEGPYAIEYGCNCWNFGPERPCPNCSMSTTCGSCLAQGSTSPCVWCGATQSCVEAAGNGSKTQCSGKQQQCGALGGASDCWKTLISTCPVHNSQYVSCPSFNSSASCIANSNCGWCKDDNLCYEASTLDNTCTKKCNSFVQYTGSSGSSGWKTAILWILVIIAILGVVVMAISCYRYRSAKAVNLDDGETGLLSNTGYTQMQDRSGPSISNPTPHARSQLPSSGPAIQPKDLI